MKKVAIEFEEIKGWLIETQEEDRYFFFEKSEQEAIALFMKQNGFLLKNTETLITAEIVLYKIYKRGKIIYSIVTFKKNGDIVVGYGYDECNDQVELCDEEAEGILSTLK